MKILDNVFIKYAVIFSILSLVIVVNFSVLYSHVKDNAISVREREVMKSAMDFNTFLTDSIDAINLSCKTVEDMKKEGASSGEILEYLTSTSRVYAETINRNFTGFYGYINGEYLDGSGWEPDEDFVPTERPWYKEAISADGEVSFVSPYLDVDTGSMTMSVVQMLKDSTDVVSVDVTLDYIQKILDESVVKNGWKYGIVLDKTGVAVAHSEPDEIGKNYYEENKGMSAAFVKQADEEGSHYIMLKYNGKRYAAISSEINDGWRVIAVVDAGESLGSLRGILILFLVTFFAVVLGILYFNIKMRIKIMQEAYLDRQVKSMANIYDLVYLIDPVADKIYEITANMPSVKMIIDDGEDDAQYKIRAIMDSITSKRYKKTIYDFIDFSTVDQRMDDQKVISKMFDGVDGERYGVRITPVERDKDNKLTKIILMLEDLNDI